MDAIIGVLLAGTRSAVVVGATERTLMRLGQRFRKVYLHPNGHASY